MKHYEAFLKREYAKLYKERYGKGPDLISVRIIENIIIFKISGALNEMELSLLKTEPGREMVAKIRDEMILKQRAYVPIVESILGQKVSDACYSIDWNKEELYLFVICEDDIKPEKNEAD